MFLTKQLLKALLMPPVIWLAVLCLVLVFWRRRWARKLLMATLVLIFLLHSGLVSRGAGYYLESRYAPIRDCQAAGPYDAIVVLTGGLTPASGLMPRPDIELSTFRRLDEAFRLYRAAPRPIVVAGGHVDPFTKSGGENSIACEYLTRWGVPAADVIPEPDSRDTLENAHGVRRILQRRGWRRYLLVTSAVHMPRSMLIFARVAPEPVPAPSDYTVSSVGASPVGLLPAERAAEDVYSVINEYLGLLYYRVRITGWSNP